tara:strand:+ start:1151 stop:1438 length:288 start_codon:yes stop_codon:yes gene_type:complete
MPRSKTACNITNYHYRADVYDDNGKMIVSKYYYTLKEMCDEFRTSTFTAYRIIKDKQYEPKTSNLKGIKFFKDMKQAIITSIVPNSEIYGVLDDC